MAEVVVAAEAKRLATSLAKKGGQRLAVAVMGTEDERRLMRVCRVALDRSAREVAPDLTKEEFIHLVGIFIELVDSLGVPGLPVVAGDTARSAELAQVWSEGLRSLRYDVTTLPVGVADFVARLCTILPELLRAEAR